MIFELTILTIIYIFTSTKILVWDPSELKYEVNVDFGDQDFCLVLEHECIDFFEKNENFLINNDFQAKLVEVIYNIFIVLIKSRRYFKKTNKNLNSEKKLYDLRYMSSLQRWYARLLILKFIKEGYSIKAIVRLFSVDKHTVSAIKKKFDANPNFDLEELKDKKRGPKTKEEKIPENVFMELLNVLIDYTPVKFKIDSPTWSAKAILEYLEQEHSVNVSLRYLYSFLARKQITSKFATRVNYKQDKAAKEEFIHNKYKLICLQAFTEGRLLFFADETSTLRGHHLRGYAPKGSRALLAFDPGVMHTGQSALTFLSPEGEYKAFTIDGAFTSKVFISKLEVLREVFPDRKFLIILDNCGVHKSKEVNDWITKMKENEDETFVFEWLPPYCPEINPVEYFNNAYKNYLRKKGSKTKKDVIEDSDDFFWEMNQSENKKEFVQSFFLGETCSYSMLTYLEARDEFMGGQAA